MLTERARHEIEHGKKLLEMDAEMTWGWGSPAGIKRAIRRGGMISDAARLDSDRRVLEVGCGTGLFTEMLARSGAEILAVDISEDLLVHARRRGLSEEKVRFLAEPFEQCDVYGPFDAVVGSSVLHHLEVEVSLRKIFSLLSPGGSMVFAEPNMLNPQIFVQKNIPFIKKFLGDSPDETAFVRWSLKNLLETIGFVDVRITPVDWLHPHTPKSLIPSVAWMGRLLEKTPLVREFSGSLLIQARRPETDATSRAA